MPAKSLHPPRPPPLPLHQPLSPGPRPGPMGREPPAGLPAGPPVLIVVDGTWRQAREMVAASLPFLSGFAARVEIGGGVDKSLEGESAYESELVLKKEPFKGCVCTLEAVARALRVLEPEGVRVEVERVLIGVLRVMVAFQKRHLKPMEPRPRMRKNKERAAENGS